jgi:hypothetical protein
VTADQRGGAFLATLALSQRVSRLHQLDAAEYQGRHRKPHNEARPAVQG